MDSFRDFCNWMKPVRQVRIAELLDRSEASVSRMKNGKQPVTREIAERCEELSHGVFTKERVMFPDDKAA
jgi:hypothetical protein